MPMDSCNVSKCQMKSANSVVQTDDICVFQFIFPGDCIYFAIRQMPIWIFFCWKTWPSIMRKYSLVAAVKWSSWTWRISTGRTWTTRNTSMSATVTRWDISGSWKKYEAMKYYQCLTLGTFSKPDTCKKYQSLVSLMRLLPDKIYLAAGKNTRQWNIISVWH